MTIRGIIWAVIVALAGVLSAGVTLFGIGSALGLDFRQDTLLSVVYCAMPILCLPVFVLLRASARAGILLSLMALTFLGAYSALNWRTCSSAGYCDSIFLTVFQTLSTNRALSFFGVVSLILLGQLLDDRADIWRN